MKKIISLSMASLLLLPTIAAAEFDVYGDIRLGLNKADAAQKDWQVTDELSRIGLKGSFDLVEDVTALYQAEFRLHADTGEFAGSGEKNARLAWVGAKGSWGKTQIGRIWMPSQLWLANKAAGGFNDVELNGVRALTHRMPNVVSYESPKMGGIQLAGSAVLGGSGGRFGDIIDDGSPKAFNSDNNDSSVDLYSFAAQYQIGGFGVAAGYSTGDATDAANSEDYDFDYSQFYVQYSTKPLKVYAYYQEEDGLEGDGVELETLAAGAIYRQGKNSYHLQYTEHDKNNGVDGDRVAVGYTRKLNNPCPSLGRVRLRQYQ
ncbi:MAG: porin [Halopseudomonas sp.]